MATQPDARGSGMNAMTGRPGVSTLWPGEVASLTCSSSLLLSFGPLSWPGSKASASRAEDPGFESRLRQDFFGVESYQ